MSDEPQDDGWRVYPSTSERETPPPEAELSPGGQWATLYGWQEDPPGRTIVKVWWKLTGDPAKLTRQESTKG